VVSVPSASDDLQATAADVVADVERLKEVELEKASLHPANPRLKVLAAEAEAIARELPIKTAAESDLVRELADGAAAAD
jgi:hypothetical protein